MKLKIISKFRQTGAALVELTLVFPVALTIVLASVHLSDVITESTVIIEAARHGARSVTAASSIPPAPSWSSTTSSSGFTVCPQVIPTVATNPHEIALFSVCDFLSKYFNADWPTEYANWEVQSSISLATESGVNFWLTSVTLRPNRPRGPVDFFIPFINLKPQSTSVFPLMKTGI